MHIFNQWGGGIFKATAVIGGLHYISSPNFLPCLSLYGSRKIIESGSARTSFLEIGFYYKTTFLNACERVAKCVYGRATTINDAGGLQCSVVMRLLPRESFPRPRSSVSPVLLPETDVDCGKTRDNYCSVV